MLIAGVGKLYISHDIDASQELLPYRVILAHSDRVVPASDIYGQTDLSWLKRHDPMHQAGEGIIRIYDIDIEDCSLPQLHPSYTLGHIDPTFGLHCD